MEVEVTGEFVALSNTTGDSDRDIARARLMGRHKVARLRALALVAHPWGYAADWPDVAGPWRNVDRRPDAAARRARWRSSSG